ncbi:MAG: MmgE/PrpD family protein [Gammaproteobacteria bacterium]|nr:MmgE/PrpD family protein [Gammaproteobacteria bacterium]
MQTTTKLVEYCAEVEFDMLPTPAVEAAKIELLDCLGVGLAAIDAPGVAELMRLNSVWGGKQESAVLGYNISLPAPNAAQMNATIMHARDFDDIHARSLTHPGIISVSSALATAELVGGVSGKDFLAALAMGTDLICRLGMAVRSDQPRGALGWHFTAVFGFPASAAVAGRLLRLNQEKMLNALAIAYHQSSGNGQCVLDGALTKRLGPGFAVRGGITAALLAEAGVTGASGWLEGEAGIYQLYFRSPCNDRTLLSELGVRFEGANVATKRYPGCGAVHPYIDATLHLMGNNKFATGDIEEIVVVHGEGTRFLIEPVKAKCEPRNPVDLQFSVPWVVATALAEGKVTLEHFTEEAIRNEKITSLSARVVPVFDSKFSRIDGAEAGKVELKLKGKRHLAAMCENTVNEGGQRMTFADCTNKFYACADFSILEIDAKALRKVVELVKDFEDVRDASELIRLLQPGK